MRRTVLVSVLTAALVSALFVTGPALAKAISTGGGLARGLADSLYCAVAGGTGCTMAGDIEGAIAFQDSDNDIDIKDAAGTAEASILTETTSNDVLFCNDASAGGCAKFEAQGTWIGSKFNRSGGESTGGFSESNTTTTRVELFAVYGTGTYRPMPIATTAIGSPTDTTTSPIAGGSTCRMAAAGGAAAWTPVETDALDGMMFCCMNTGTNAITMTDSDGVYEGPGSIVGQYDVVCFLYGVDRWVEYSFSNNEP